MGRCYHHLTLTDRYTIEKMFNQKYTPKEIAETLKVHVSTIYRERKRARTVFLTTDLIEVERYNADAAERQYRERLAMKGPQLKIGKDHAFAEYIERKICDERMSPAAALASIKIEGKHFDTNICVTTLYNYIDRGVFLRLTNKDLPIKSHKKRRYRKVKRMKQPPKGTSIEKRPPEGDARNTMGHWEGDTVYGGKDSSPGVLFVYTERLARREIIVPMPDRTAESGVAALDLIERRFGKLFPKIFKTITFDNGNEFANAADLERSVFDPSKRRTQAFFCHAYCSHERGTNENTNRLIRRWYPKGTDLSQIDEAEAQRLEAWINNYPRKSLDWKTADMVFDEWIKELQAEG